MCVSLCVFLLCKVYILGRLMRSYSAIESMPFIKYIVNILSENLGAEERILLDMQTHWRCLSLSHTNTQLRQKININILL